MKPKLSLSTFGLPVQELRRGYYADVYFWRTKRILENEGVDSRALMQVFQKNDAILCGVDEALAVFRVATGRYRDPERAFKLFDRHVELKQETREVEAASALGFDTYDDLIRLSIDNLQLEKDLNALWEDKFDTLAIHALEDGNPISSWETVMTIEGAGRYFAHLETIYLGILARRTRVATNVARVVEAADGKEVLFFPARFDHYAIQTGDGYAASVSGATGVSTDAQGEWLGVKGVGTKPHALIAFYKGGDTVEATLAFQRNYPDVRLISLVDFENDCVKTSLDVARVTRDKGIELYGVRLDTSGNMVDKSVVPYMSNFKPTGVCEQLVWNVRNALDKEGFSGVKIYLSGGFNPEKIRRFRKAGTPEDGYGVGSSCYDGNFDMTADVVTVEGKPCAKVGRKYNPNPRLTRVEY